MKGTIVEISKDESGTHFGIKIDDQTLPLPDGEFDVRNSGLGSSVTFLTTREGVPCITSHPQVRGCRERKT